MKRSTLKWPLCNDCGDAIKREGAATDATDGAATEDPSGCNSSPLLVVLHIKGPCDQINASS
jgi:hypothetical protein